MPTGDTSGLTPTAPTVEHFSSLSDNDRKLYVEKIAEDFFAVVNELEGGSHYYVAESSRKYKKYELQKNIIAIMTLLLAILNVIVALDWKGITGSSEPLTMLIVLSAFNAAYAGVLSSLRAFFKIEGHLEEAKTHQISASVLNEANLRLTNRWKIYVTPFAVSAQACVNAAALSQEVVLEDSRLRSVLDDVSGSGG